MKASLSLSKAAWQAGDHAAAAAAAAETVAIYQDIGDAPGEAAIASAA